MSSETKWGYAITLILGFLGLGVMSGQNFAVNGLVFFFWALAVITLIVTLLHKDPKPLPPPAPDPPSLTESVVRQLEARIYDDAKHVATIKELRGSPESSTGVLHTEWDTAESNAQEKKGKFIAAKVVSAEKQIKSVLDTRIAEWNVNVSSLLKPPTKLLPLDVHVYLEANDPKGPLQIKCVNREAVTIESAAFVVTDILRWNQDLERYVTNRDIHDSGVNFVAKELQKATLHPGEAEKFGFVLGGNERIDLADKTIRTPGNWMIAYRVVAPNGRAGKGHVCFEWLGGNTAPVSAECLPKRKWISTAPPPITPLRGGG